jgi:hypothetical protein
LRPFVIIGSEPDLTSRTGLAFTGMALNARTHLTKATAGISLLRSDAMPHAGIFSCYVALLGLGKSDFEAINGFRVNAYFAEAPDSNRRPPKTSCASVWTPTPRATRR